jgi:regulator of RNase E activity RraA
MNSPDLGDRDPSLETLARLDTCSVSDALDRLGISGVLDGLVPLSVRKPIAGRAVTVSLAKIDRASASPAGPASARRHLATAAVEAAVAGSVLVISHPGGECAGWGGILSRAARARGVAGVVVGGACRDIDEAIDLGFPIYGRSATPRTARGRLIEAAWNVPVRIGDVEIHPGSLVIADSSGVVVLPQDPARTLQTALEIAEREAEIAAAVDGGVAVSAAMGAFYERLVER